MFYKYIGRLNKGWQQGWRTGGRISKQPQIGEKNVQEDLKSAKITDTDVKDRNAFRENKIMGSHSRGTA